MSSYSEAELHLDSDTEEVEFNCGNGADNDIDTEDIEFNSGNDAFNQQGKENPNGYKCINDVTNDEIRAMIFKTQNEAIEFYKTYARFNGFAIRLADVRRKDGKIVMRQILCNKEGAVETNDEGHSKSTIRTGCKARLRVVYDFKIEHWKVSFFEPSHNHDLTPPSMVHLIPNYRKLSEVDKQVASGLHSQGVRTCHILGFLMGQKGGHEGLGFISKDLYNYTDHQARVRIKDGDTFATLIYFQGKADSDSTFFSEFTFTDDGRLENIFWADSASRFDYECFGDVLAFDTTYRKNRYGKPLVIFSGYNHHGETTVFACALICDETIETYKWVLNLFSKAMYDKHPKAVITDGDKSMRESIRVVFPNTRHRLCSWHLFKNARKHVHNSKILQELNSLMYSHYTPEKFESEWKRVVDSCGVSKNKWVNDTYDMKRMWASAYMREHFVCGVRTTSICEGVNSFIKKYIQHKNSIVDFLHNFERALKDYRHNELMSDFKSFYYHPVMTTALPEFEVEASKIFTRKKFKVVKKAIEGVAALSITERIEKGDNVIFKVNIYRNKDVTIWVHLDKLHTKFLCDCRLFERKGLPCSHIFCAMKHEDIDVFPESLVCKRWTKTAKSDHIASLATQEGDDEKMSMFRRGALVAAFSSLCDVSCKSASDYKIALEGIYSLSDKINRRRSEGNGHGKHKTSEFAAGDPLMVKTKGAPRKKKSTTKRKCSHCRKAGHIKRICPELVEKDVIFEDEKEEASPDESNNESKSLSVSLSDDMNDDTHSMAMSNGKQDVEKNTSTKRMRESDNIAFSTQSSVNKRTANTIPRKGDACVTPNIAINIDNNDMTHDFRYDNSTLKRDNHSARQNHDVGHDGSSFPRFASHSNTVLHAGTNSVPSYKSNDMTHGFRYDNSTLKPDNHSARQNHDVGHDGSSFPQFASHSNTVLHTGTNSVPSDKSFMSVLEEVERLAKQRMP